MDLNRLDILSVYVIECVNTLGKGMKKEGKNSTVFEKNIIIKTSTWHKPIHFEIKTSKLKLFDIISEAVFTSLVNLSNLRKNKYLVTKLLFHYLSYCINISIIPTLHNIIISFIWNICMH